MVTTDEMEAMLDELAGQLPQEIYKELNGGIILLPEVKMNPIGRKNDLYILGQYHSGGLMGRYISIYYGSFAKVFGHLSREALKQELMKTLKHEFTHHLESLAGEHGLEIKDEEYLENYLRNVRKPR